MIMRSRRRHTTLVSDWSSDVCFFFSSRRRHTRLVSDWSSDVCSSDLPGCRSAAPRPGPAGAGSRARAAGGTAGGRSEEHTSELQSLTNLVCRLLLEKKKNYLSTIQDDRLLNSRVNDVRT